MIDLNDEQKDIAFNTVVELVNGYIRLPNPTYGEGEIPTYYPVAKANALKSLTDVLSVLSAYEYNSLKLEKIISEDLDMKLMGNVFRYAANLSSSEKVGECMRRAFSVPSDKRKPVLWYMEAIARSYSINMEEIKFSVMDFVDNNYFSKIKAAEDKAMRSPGTMAIEENGALFSILTYNPSVRDIIDRLCQCISNIGRWDVRNTRISDAFENEPEELTDTDIYGLVLTPMLIVTWIRGTDDVIGAMNRFMEREFPLQEDIVNR